MVLVLLNIVVVVVDVSGMLIFNSEIGEFFDVVIVSDVVDGSVNVINDVLNVFLFGNIMVIFIVIDLLDLMGIV